MSNTNGWIYATSLLLFIAGFLIGGFVATPKDVVKSSTNPYNPDYSFKIDWMGDFYDCNGTMTVTAFKNGRQVGKVACVGYAVIRTPDVDSFIIKQITTQ